MTSILFKTTSFSFTTPLKPEETMPIILGSTAQVVYTDLQGENNIAITNEIAKQCDMLIQNFENDYFAISISDKK